MPSTTSLLKSAASAKRKALSYQDSVVAFEWANSAQTYEEFQAYSKYLQDRQDKASDPSEALSYAKNIVTARKSYVSNELQRQTMAVMEGRATTTDKLNTVYSFYQQAVENGDYNLAQNLASQYDSLTIKLQNEAQAAQSAAATMAMNGVKSLDQLIKKATKGEELLELPDGNVIKPIAVLNDELRTSGDSSNGQYFKEIFDTIQAIQQTVADAYNGAQTQDVVDSIESKFGDIITGDKTFDTAAGKLTVQDIELAYRSALANNPLYSPTESRNPNTGELEFKLAKNKIDDFTWIRNDDGTYQAIEQTAKVTSPNQTLDSKITNEGYLVGDTGKTGVGLIGTGEEIKSGSAASIKERLLQQGVTASQNADGTLDLILPSGEQVKGAIQPDGSVRYFGKPGDYSGGQAGMYELNVLSGQTREVAPDESSIFGQQSIFGGQLSKASDAGTKITKSLAGVTKPMEGLLGPNARITNLLNDFSGEGVPVLGRNLQGTPTEILTAAQTVQQQMKQDLQAKASAMQSSNVFNLNQTPVQQFAQNGAPIKQLTVSAPPKTPSLSVAAPTPAPRVTVTQAPAPPKVTVTKSPQLPKLSVR